MNTLRTVRTSAAALGIALAVSACDNGITDLNRNPNSPDAATPEYLFANATEAAVSRVFGTGLHMDITALWAQHYAEHRFSTEDRYTISDGSISGHWSGFYAGPLQDFQEAIMLAADDQRPNAVAQGRIMQSWTFHVVTDLWGDIGYSEALQGRNPASGSTPALDPQADVYAALLADLAATQGSFVPGGQELVTADLIYGGDTDAWVKFANSLRLRLAMRLSEVDATTGSAEFENALLAGVFESNDDNATLTYIEGGTNVHPLFSYERDRDDHSVSATIIDTLISYADPRLPIYAKPTAAGTYVGMPNGSTVQPALTAISKIGSFFSDADASAFLMTYAEVLFLRAEAAERGWTTENAAQLYADAIRASMEQVGVAPGDIDTYLAQARVTYVPGATGLEQIGLQKWIALYGNGVEAWSEWRRTGFPQLLPGPDALNDGLIPVRLPYPQREISLNGANVQEAIDRQGGASLNDPIWWMP
jgi:hypothetical protein